MCPGSWPLIKFQVIFSSRYPLINIKKPMIAFLLMIPIQECLSGAL